MRNPKEKITIRKTNYETFSISKHTNGDGCWGKYVTLKSIDDKKGKWRLTQYKCDVCGYIFWDIHTTDFCLVEKVCK